MPPVYSGTVPLSLCLSLSVSLSLCLSVSLSIYLSFYLSLSYLSLSSPFSLFSLSLSLFLFLPLFLYSSLSLSLSLSKIINSAVNSTVKSAVIEVNIGRYRRYFSRYLCVLVLIWTGTGQQKCSIGIPAFRLAQHLTVARTATQTPNPKPQIPKTEIQELWQSGSPSISARCESPSSPRNVWKLFRAALAGFSFSRNFLLGPGTKWRGAS